jgi:hypothetical protein
MDANPGEPWSKTDIDDLKASLAFGNGIAATANMLCRDEEKVREKAKARKITENRCPQAGVRRCLEPSHLTCSP